MCLIWVDWLSGEAIIVFGDNSFEGIIENKVVGAVLTKIGQVPATK